MKGIIPTKVVEEWWEAPDLDPMDLKPEPVSDVLLIVGDGACVLDDLERFIEFGVSYHTMAINYAPRIIPWEIQHYIAGDSHLEDMQGVAKDLGDGVIKHCWNPNSKGFDVRWIKNDRVGWTGTTANLGIKIGIQLDYLKIVLCGIPMDDSGNWYKDLLPEGDIKTHKNHKNHLWKWTEIASRPQARLIRSMSGSTAELFGEPTREWLIDC